MDISIIIVNYNVKDYIISCIESIYKHTKAGVSFEIIVIDNNSTDGSIDELKKKFSEIKLILNQTNEGFSKGVNRGVKYASGKFLLILNPDTLLIEDSLSKLFFEAKKLSGFGAIGPKIVDANGRAQNSFWMLPTILNTFLAIFHLDFLNIKKNYSNKNFYNITQVESISGCAFFTTKDVYLSLNGFNNDLFWMEDIDLCLRMKKIGLKVFYSPATKLIHYVSQSAKTNYKIAVSNQLFSKYKYFKIHTNKLKSLIIFFFILNHILIKLVILSLISPFSKNHRKKLAAYFFTLFSIKKVF